MSMLSCRACHQKRIHATCLSSWFQWSQCSDPRHVRHVTSDEGTQHAIRVMFPGRVKQTFEAKELSNKSSPESLKQKNVTNANCVHVLGL